jgi:hypothetical protein
MEIDFVGEVGFEVVMKFFVGVAIAVGGGDD